MDKPLKNNSRPKQAERLLITGASGLLGSTLAPLLAAGDHNIYCHGNTRKSDLNCDLTDRGATKTLLETVRPNIIINLVALSHVDQCEKELHRAYRSNVLTVENLVAGLKEHPNTLLIQISTDQIYDNKGPSREEEVRPTNIYGLTKYAGELAAGSIPCVILRTNFFGYSRLPGRESLSDWVIRSLQNKKDITAFTDILFNPVTMTTLGKLIARVIAKPVMGTYNIGSCGPMTKAGFIFEIAETLNLSTETIKLGRSDDLGLKACRPKDMSMDCSLFESTFNIRLPSLKDEIAGLKRIKP